MDESDRRMDHRVRASTRELVEFPHEGAYTLGFVTTETPVRLSEAEDCTETLTPFLPLAPNPEMGGHLVRVPANKVTDVDVTVEGRTVASGVDSDHVHVTPAEQADRYDRKRDTTENRPAEVTDRDVQERASTEMQPAEVSNGESGKAGAGIEDGADPTDGTPTELGER